LEKETYIDKNLQEKFSDIIYKVKLQDETAYIYTLLEHKSKAYRFTALQLQKYMNAQWERHLQQNKRSKTLPVIIPLVIYHGKRKWLSHAGRIRFHLTL
ncbi:MAG: Rpn family recombination-promoting nuclease/putative transposase, partial [Spirochaetota bacterium]